MQREQNVPINEVENLELNEAAAGSEDEESSEDDEKAAEVKQKVRNSKE